MHEIDRIERAGEHSTSNSDLPSMIIAHRQTIYGKCPLCFTSFLF